jgi:hypothetical protein
VSAHQILPHVLDRADHIAEMLIGDRGNKREAQFAGR